jgi:uncharacterized membrane protein YheB (UPF0754 family)
MRRPAKLQRDMNRLMRRTDLRSDQLYDKVKDFVETSDEMADRVCYTVRKVLNTADDAADTLHETLKKILGTENTLRNRLTGLLELDDLSETQLEHEIRRFLDVASERARETSESYFPERDPDEFRRSGRTAGDKADELLGRLEDILESEKPLGELKTQIREMIDSFKDKSESMAARAKTRFDEKSGEFRDSLKNLTKGRGTSEEQLRQKVSDLLENYDVGTRKGLTRSQNKRFAKAVDKYLKADGKLLRKYERLENFDQPVNGALLLALVSFLGRREQTKMQEAAEHPLEKEFKRAQESHEQARGLEPH